MPYHLCKHCPTDLARCALLPTTRLGPATTCLLSFRRRSTMFLMGPVNQCKRMLHHGRIIATLIYLSCIVVTLIVAFKVITALRCTARLPSPAAAAAACPPLPSLCMRQPMYCGCHLCTLDAVAVSPT